MTCGLRIGISGWRYTGWRGKFYPSNLAQRGELAFASSIFNTVEINGSFYSLQLPSSYQRWFAETPPGFLFGVKGARFITHMKKLREVKIPLPQTTSEAASLARSHNEKLKARAWLKIDRDRPLRYAFKIRHPSFLVPEFFSLLRDGRLLSSLRIRLANGHTSRNSPLILFTCVSTVTVSFMSAAIASPRSNRGPDGFGAGEESMTSSSTSTTTPRSTRHSTPSVWPGFWSND